MGNHRNQTELHDWLQVEPSRAQIKGERNRPRFGKGCLIDEGSTEIGDHPLCEHTGPYRHRFHLAEEGASTEGTL